MSAAEAFFTGANVLLYSVGAAHPEKNEAARRWVGALIVSAAELSGSRWLLTEDLQDGRTFESVTVVNPFRVSPAHFGLTAPV